MRAWGDGRSSSWAAWIWAPLEVILLNPYSPFKPQNLFRPPILSVRSFALLRDSSTIVVSKKKKINDCASVTHRFDPSFAVLYREWSPCVLTIFPCSAERPLACSLAFCCTPVPCFPLEHTFSPLLTATAEKEQMKKKERRSNLDNWQHFPICFRNKINRCNFPNTNRLVVAIIFN